MRGTDREAALQSVLALVDAGIGMVEVSLTTPDADVVIAEARDALGPDALLGCGTVVTADDATRAADCGAGYVVTPTSVRCSTRFPICPSCRSVASTRIRRAHTSPRGQQR